ncbi:hypothetical protein BT63DRAFT_430007 [Microthyrium microscopicum]|uniref:Adipose-regulatory protein-domain-containing protein n=1 Tax=Microthyrium microscopicum TaxID=703497 RepID=A0A6A6TYH9_9PEZI|nr:hypothetical protein BT63DRAFT_430007 [Microthyrium microscopicum]
MVTSSDDDEEEVGLIVAASDAVLKPLRYATSKPAQRVYLGTLFFLLTGLTLLGFAITAYLLFYYSYVPIRGFSQPIYLQFEPGKHPYGIVQLQKGHVVSDQPYDVDVHLNLPRTPTNTAAGNFMIDVQLFAPSSTTWTENTPKVLVAERRPAIMTYHSPTLEHVYKAVELPLYITGWRKEAEKLTVPLLEGVEFARGWQTVPTSVRIELQSATPLQVYEMTIAFRARLRGIRYMMINYRLSSFVFFTSIFWSVEMTIAACIWVGLSFVFTGKQSQQPAVEQKSEPQIKAEGDILPETNAEPSSPPATPRIKDENDPESVLETYPQATEADVEDEEAGPGSSHKARYSDSGLGTSFESSHGSARRDVVRRRSSKNLTED